ELLLRVDFRVALRAFQDVPRTVREPGAGDDRRHPDLLEQLGIGADTLGCEADGIARQLPRATNVGVGSIGRHQHQGALRELWIVWKATLPFLTPVSSRYKQLQVVRGDKQKVQDRVGGREKRVRLVRTAGGAVGVDYVTPLVVVERVNVLGAH